MKLLMCRICSDIIPFGRCGEPRYCKCKMCWGEYKEDGWYAKMSGPAIPLGFANFSFVNAIKNQPEIAPGKEFVAFVIEKDCPRIEVIKDVNTKAIKKIKRTKKNKLATRKTKRKKIRTSRKCLAARAI